MKIIITGDSHMSALKFGADMLSGQGEMPQDCQIDMKSLGNGGTLTTPFFIDKGDFAEMKDLKHPRGLKKMSSIKRLPFSEDEGRYEYYGICGPLHSVRIWRRKGYWPNFTPFMFQGGQAPVSTNMLKHVVLKDQQYIMKLIELLKRVGVKVFVIEPPKPFKHHQILELVNRDVILYIDGFYRKVMREWLATIDVPVINVPSDCYDADGFMLEAFRHDDPTDGYHGNKEFGAVMVKEIIEFVKLQN